MIKISTIQTKAMIPNLSEPDEPDENEEQEETDNTDDDTDAEE